MERKLDISTIPVQEPETGIAKINTLEKKT